MALEALQSLIGNPAWLARFMDESGSDAAALRAGASDPAFLGAVLDFIAAHEDLAAEFCARQGVDGAGLELARHRMATRGIGP